MVEATLDRLWARYGSEVRDARRARNWSTQRLADEAGVSRSLVYLTERGEPTSLEAATRLAVALGLRPELALVDPRRRGVTALRSEDPVHAAMAEAEAARFRGHRYPVAVDEPYQHYQFAGRADLLTWDLQARTLLHIENRTRFPNVGESAGSYNAKRSYLPDVLAERLGICRWASVTNAIVALWSSEVLHVLRLRTETFRSLCPDPVDVFDAWWSGAPPSSATQSTLVVFDPFASARARPFVGLDDALSVRPRVRGYAEAAERLRAGESR